MNQFSVQCGKLELRSVKHPYTVAEFIYHRDAPAIEVLKSDKEEIVVATFVITKDPPDFTLKVDTSKLRDDEELSRETFSKLVNVLLCICEQIILDGQQKLMWEGDKENFKLEEDDEEEDTDDEFESDEEI